MTNSHIKPSGGQYNVVYSHGVKDHYLYKSKAYIENWKTWSKCKQLNIIHVPMLAAQQRIHKMQNIPMIRPLFFCNVIISTRTFMLQAVIFIFIILNLSFISAQAFSSLNVACAVDDGCGFRFSKTLVSCYWFKPSLFCIVHWKLPLA